MENDNPETPTVRPAWPVRAWGSIKALPWWGWLLIAVTSCFFLLWIAPDWMAFWGRCIQRSWGLAFGIFGWVQGLCGLFAAGLLAHKRLATKIPADWEDTAMKTAWLILLGSFIVSTVFIAPFLETADSKAIAESAKSESDKTLAVFSERLREIEAQGPHLYKATTKIENEGKLKDGKFVISFDLRNESNYAAVDPEIMWAIAIQRWGGAFEVVTTRRSVGAEIAPRFKIAGEVILDAERIPPTTGAWMPETIDLVLFVAARYQHPKTGDISYHQPIIERSVCDLRTWQARPFDSVTIEDRNRFLKIFEQVYQEFKNSRRTD